MFRKSILTLAGILALVAGMGSAVASGSNVPDCCKNSQCDKSMGDSGATTGKLDARAPRSR